MNDFFVSLPIERSLRSASEENRVFMHAKYAWAAPPLLVLVDERKLLGDQLSSARASKKRIADWVRERLLEQAPLAPSPIFESGTTLSFLCEHLRASLQTNCVQVYAYDADQETDLLRSWSPETEEFVCIHFCIGIRWEAAFIPAALLDEIVQLTRIERALKKRLKNLSHQIHLLLRRLNALDVLRRIVLLERPWFCVHGCHPPRPEALRHAWALSFPGSRALTA